MSRQFENYCDAVPMPGFLIAAVAGLAAGIGIGFLLGYLKYGRTDTKEIPMKKPTREGFSQFRARARETYEVFAPWVLLVSIVAAAAGVWFGVVSIRNDNRQDAAQADLVKCLDDYVAGLSSALPAVREASIARDVATEARDTALKDQSSAVKVQSRAFKQLIVDSLAGRIDGPEDLDEIKRATARVTATSEVLDTKAEELQVAQAALVTAREENPYPPAPSEFCSAEPAPTPGAPTITGTTD